MLGDSFNTVGCVDVGDAASPICLYTKDNYFLITFYSLKICIKKCLKREYFSQLRNQ